MRQFFSSLGCLRIFQPTGPTDRRIHHPNGEREVNPYWDTDRIPEQVPRARYMGHTSRLFALLIGINTYSNCRKLRGAIADAEALKAYLQEDLRVPENRIYMLLDTRATREAIIWAFRGLRNNRHIRNGDPILIFFAGHGSEVYPPKAWGIKGKIQCLLPHDYNTTDIPPIPDRTIGALIDEIARTKGDNITAVFDCCFAAGATRYDKLGEEYEPRTVDLHANILKELDDLDQDILGDRYGGIPDGFEHEGARSHVLLAACGENELAYEHKRYGLFTSALLTMLRGVVIHTLTYAEAIDKINLESQHPRCVGINQRRVFFDSRIPVGAQVRYRTQVNNTGNFVVRAGLAHGVAHGVEFTLYNGQDQILGIIVVDRRATVKDFKTTVMVAGHLRYAETASLTRVGAVSFYLQPRGRSALSIVGNPSQRAEGNGTRSQTFRIIDNPEGAKLEVATLGNNRVVFGILDESTKRIGLTKLPHEVTPDTVAHILNAAAHYYWYLHKTDNPGGLNHQVIVDFHGLEKEDDDEEPQSGYIPVESGLCRKNRTHDSDVIDFFVDRHEYYGISIANRTGRDLYLNAFLFNSSSLSIAPYYLQSTVGRPEAPLKRDETLTIGYGNSGQPPFRFWLDKNQKVDVGYLKIFFATRPIDLADIVQESPFKSFSKRRHKLSPDDAREGAPTQEANDVGDLWFTKVIPVVQRRR